jgi:hypothetical protein
MAINAAYRVSQRSIPGFARNMRGSKPTTTTTRGMNDAGKTNRIIENLVSHEDADLNRVYIVDICEFFYKYLFISIYPEQIIPIYDKMFNVFAHSLKHNKQNFSLDHNIVDEMVNFVRAQGANNSVCAVSSFDLSTPQNFHHQDNKQFSRLIKFINAQQDIQDAINDCSANSNKWVVLDTGILINCNPANEKQDGHAVITLVRASDGLVLVVDPNNRECKSVGYGNVDNVLPSKMINSIIGPMLNRRRKHICSLTANETCAEDHQPNMGEACVVMSISGTAKNKDRQLKRDNMYKRLDLQMSIQPEWNRIHGIMSSLGDGYMGTYAGTCTHLSTLMVHRILVMDIKNELVIRTPLQIQSDVTEMIQAFVALPFPLLTLIIWTYIVEGHDSTLEKTKEMNLNFKRRQADDDTVDREREDKRHKPNSIFTDNIENSIIPQQPLHPSMMSELDVPLHDMTDMRNVDSDDAEPVNVIVFPALIVDQLTTQYNIPVLTPPVFPVIYSPMRARL